MDYGPSPHPPGFLLQQKATPRRGALRPRGPDSEVRASTQMRVTNVFPAERSNADQGPHPRTVGRLEYATQIPPCHYDERNVFSNLNPRKRCEAIKKKPWTSDYELGRPSGAGMNEGRRFFSSITKYVFPPPGTYRRRSESTTANSDAELASRPRNEEGTFPKT